MASKGLCSRKGGRTYESSVIQAGSILCAGGCHGPVYVRSCGSALAESRTAEVQNHAQADGRTAIGNVRIDGVDAPKANAPLDDAARVTAEPNATWDIPVLWVSDDLALVTEAREGVAYLPVLAFYVPQDYALEGDAATVELSESLTALFGGTEIVSVYNDATGITYILPASLWSLFASSQGDAAAVSDEGQASESTAAPSDFESAVERGAQPTPAKDPHHIECSTFHSIIFQDLE